MARLCVEGLTKRFGAVTAVDDVSFEVRPSEFLSLLGPSGCGKTTTLRCIAGFEKPDAGRITLDGAPLTDLAQGVFVPPYRRRFGMVFQSYAVWPHMTVFSNVGYPLRVRGGHSRAAIRERVLSTLQLVGLGGLEERYPTQLSGGQQQRVALARALVMEPRVLLFDEPLSNLDAKLRERMRFELMEIQLQLGIPAIYVTHDQAEAMVISKRVLVMDGGRVAQVGTPREIYNRPASRFVADFIGLANFLRGTVRSVGGAGRWMVESELGPLECVSPGGMTPDEAVLVSIRPERVQLSPAPPAAETNVLRGEIQTVVFLGPFTEYFVRVGEKVLRAQSSVPLDGGPGERIFVHVDPADCLAIPEGPAAPAAG